MPPRRRPGDTSVAAALELLDAHFNAFEAARPYAERSGHTVPSDTKSWSQILVSVLTGLQGRARKKGSDLEDGSDVKAANVWSAIDTPRFNGAIAAGRTTAAARKPPDVTALDGIPYLFFVLWDHSEKEQRPRCRIWCVRPQHDREFRKMCKKWYKGRAKGQIVSTNFQLHPPRNLDNNIIRNTCGNLAYPLFFCAERRGDKYKVIAHAPSVLTSGECQPES